MIANRILRGLAVAGMLAGGIGVAATPADAATVLTARPAAAASAVNPVTGTYTLHYRWNTGMGWATGSWTVADDGTFSDLNYHGTWIASGSTYSFTYPRGVRTDTTYTGVLTDTGLNSAASPGTMVNTARGVTGRWYADRTS